MLIKGKEELRRRGEILEEFRVKQGKTANKGKGKSEMVRDE